LVKKIKNFPTLNIRKLAICQTRIFWNSSKWDFFGTLLKFLCIRILLYWLFKHLQSRSLRQL